MQQKGAATVAGVDFKAIADLMTCEDFGRRQLPTRGRRARCPWCNGSTHYNLQFFSDGKAHCHKCHNGGDVIQLASATWGVDRLTAARQLAGELGIDTGDDGGGWRDQRQRRQRERQEREQARDDFNRRYGAACDDLHAIEAQTDRLTAADAEQDSTWKLIARLVRAQELVDRLYSEGVRV